MAQKIAHKFVNVPDRPCMRFDRFRVLIGHSVSLTSVEPLVDDSLQEVLEFIYYLTGEGVTPELFSEAALAAAKAFGSDFNIIHVE